MAQRTVHYVFGQILGERCGIGDLPRFLFGSLLPDAIVDKSDRDVSHFAYRGADGARYYEFDRFSRDFADRMNDPLYLGYYIHLVEDSYYREFCHKNHNLYFISEPEVRALHRDYHLLNPYLRETYGLTNVLAPIPGFEREPIARIARFDTAALLRELAEDLSEQPCGAFTYLSPPMMDEFIARCLPAAEAELRAVLRGESSLRAADFAWKRTYK